VASLSQGRTAAAQCGLFTHKSVPVIFEPPCIIKKFVTMHGHMNVKLTLCISEIQKSSYTRFASTLVCMMCAWGRTFISHREQSV